MARVRRRAVRCVCLLSFLALLADPTIHSVHAQQFGRNKVEYVNFDFKVLDTEHFAVYYYSSEEASARIAAQLAERWYRRFSHQLQHSLRGRQSLILYGSQPEFAQTNVVGGLLGEGVAGVTESARRRIVMTFAPTLAETNQVLGHEIAHAFQFDMVRGAAGLTSWPLWSVEGMAQYLAVGPGDSEAAMWLRDAVRFTLLPARAPQAARQFSPYRYGSAMWAYLTGRFGDRIIADILGAKGGGFETRVREATGVEFKQLFADWRTAAHEEFGVSPDVDPGGGSALLSGPKAGKVQLGPAISPSGRQAIFFSERDRLSLDLFLADTATGAITRKLATTAATARFESLQPIRSAGSWSPSGDRFIFSAVSHGRSTLVLLDISGKNRERQIPLPGLGQILTPAWSPDGRTIVFSALTGGASDLYTYELESNALRRLTTDQFSDLQPVWSLDGNSIAFTTDRFSTDLASLTFGVSQLAILDLSSGDIRPVNSATGTKEINPQWSHDGRSLYFLSDAEGLTNVYRVDVESGRIFRVSDSPDVVAGLTPTSPALSVARDAPALIVSVYRRGAYTLDIVRGDAMLAGRDINGSPTAAALALPPTDRLDGESTAALALDAVAPAPHTWPSREYPSKLFVESIGQPYLSSGGGPFGTFVRGGGSLLFSDMLGDRKLGVAVQVGNHLSEMGLGVQYLNRERRWNWGAVAVLQPSIRALPHQRIVDRDGQAGVSLETHYFEQMQLKLGGLVAYPLNQTQRIEFEGDVRQTSYRETLNSTVRSLSTGRVLDRATTTGFGGAPSSVGEVSAALVGDTAIFGATSPIVGHRYRFEIGTALGNLSFIRTLLDHRRYFMPVKPYTIATRIAHYGQYGRDADDPRLQPIFLGSRQFVRGHGWGSLHCDPSIPNDCNSLERLLGNRLVAGNLEVRFPLMGMLSREIRYGPLPVDGFVFADGGVMWTRPAADSVGGGERAVIGSIGAGLRISAFGFPLEFAAVRPLRTPAHDWTFDFTLRTGF